MAECTETCPFCGAEEVRESDRDYAHWRQFWCGALLLGVGNVYQSRECVVRSSRRAAEAAREDFGSAVAKLAAANAEIERLRSLAYAAEEFLSPEEWRFEQPSHKPGLDARLHDLEHAVDSALGDGWRDRHAANVAELSAKLRPIKDHPHA